MAGRRRRTCTPEHRPMSAANIELARQESRQSDQFTIRPARGSALYKQLQGRGVDGDQERSVPSRGCMLQIAWGSHGTTKEKPLFPRVAIRVATPQISPLFVSVRHCQNRWRCSEFEQWRTVTNVLPRSGGSRGRRFKSCHPDGKQQVRGRFGQNPRRPLCCRVAIGVATAHVLTSPLLLRAAGRRSARPGWRRGRTRPR
jgi:hypothetical protein